MGGIQLALTDIWLHIQIILIKLTNCINYINYIAQETAGTHQHLIKYSNYINYINKWEHSSFINKFACGRNF